MSPGILTHVASSEWGVIVIFMEKILSIWRDESLNLHFFPQATRERIANFHKKQAHSLGNLGPK